MARSRHDRHLLDAQLHALRPIFKAYVLAYLTSTVPRIPSTFRAISQAKDDIDQKLEILKSALLGAIGINRFPTTCAIIVAGSTILPKLLGQILFSLNRVITQPNLNKAVKLLRSKVNIICSFVSAWYAFGLLNKDRVWARKRAQSLTHISLQDYPNQHHIPPADAHMVYAGKTMDFTLFALCRAIDAAIISTWTNTRSSSLHPERALPRLSALAKRMMDPWVFATSSAVIMWSWFYSPERLPKTYNQWISKVAGIDHRLIKALRQCRTGEMNYGKSWSADADLPSLCEELNLPLEWGKPSTVVPIPCELYHCGAGKSCEIHAGQRFLKTFKLALRLYLPLQLMSFARRKTALSQRIINSLKDAARSSSFLAAFVASFYYSVCLARTRLGPKLISLQIVTRQMWDSGLCVLAGCLACGWSLLLEKQSRRQEIAFFVAPRALATLLPRVYDKRQQQRERFVFAASIAVVISAVQKDPNRVRGVLGNVLGSVLQQ